MFPCGGDGEGENVANRRISPAGGGNQRQKVCRGAPWRRRHRWQWDRDHDNGGNRRDLNGGDRRDLNGGDRRDLDNGQLFRGDAGDGGG